VLPDLTGRLFVPPPSLGAPPAHYTSVEPHTQPARGGEKREWERGERRRRRKGRREWGGGRYDQFWPVFCLKHKSVCFLIHTGREQAASSKPSQGSYLAYLAGSCLKQHAVWNYVCS